MRGWLTVAEVSRKIGLSEDRIRTLIRERKIRATKLGGWMISPEDLEAFLESRTNIPNEGGRISVRS